jgi:hypothetical protein
MIKIRLYEDYWICGDGCCSEYNVLADVSGEDKNGEGIDMRGRCVAFGWIEDSEEFRQRVVENLGLEEEEFVFE